jgi:hypothetical protein
VRRFLTATVVAVIALAGGSAANAGAPTRTADVRNFGFVDDETCAFPLDVSIDRVRTTTEFDNGDVQLHIELTVTTKANGKTWIDRDAFNIFIDASSNVWEIVGTFTHTRVVGGGTIFLQSGRIAYDVAADTIMDEHPGPHGTGADPDAYAAALCAALAP